MLFIDYLVYEAHLFRQRFVEDEAAQSALPQLAVVSDLDFRVVVQLLVLCSQKGFIQAAENLSFPFGARPLHCEIVAAQNHILGWGCNGPAVSWREDIVDGKHEQPGLRLCFQGERQVNCHLVTVEVCIVCCTYKRVNLDCPAFHQHWLKSLDAEPVEGRCPVEEHRMFADHFF